MNFMKRIAIITGASSGMGLEFARELFYNADKYQYGHFDEFWLLARRKNRLYDIAYDMNHYREKPGNENLPKVRDIEIDLTGRKGTGSFKALLDAEKLTSQKYGGFEIGLLINNAGFGTYGEFAYTPLEKELDMIDLNCTSLTGLCGLSLEYMNQGSFIINTASLASFLPLGNFAVYAATKAYVLSFSVALAAELESRGIKVCAMCPGSVSTEFANVASNGARKEVLHGKSAVKTVRHCLKAAQKGETIALWAFVWKFKAFMSRFVGKTAGARFTFKHEKRPSSF